MLKYIKDNVAFIIALLIFISAELIVSIMSKIVTNLWVHIDLWFIVWNVLNLGIFLANYKLAYKWLPPVVAISSIVSVVFVLISGAKFISAV